MQARRDSFMPEQAKARIARAFFGSPFAASISTTALCCIVVVFVVVL